MTTASKSRLVDGILIDRAFPRLESGNDCGGREITTEAGERLGAIYREIEWRDVGGVSVSYRSKVTGYRLEIWSDESERTFGSLGEATQAARDAFKVSR